MVRWQSIEWILHQWRCVMDGCPCRLPGMSSTLATHSHRGYLDLFLRTRFVERDLRRWTFSYGACINFFAIHFANLGIIPIAHTRCLQLFRSISAILAFDVTLVSFWFIMWYFTFPYTLSSDLVMCLWFFIWFFIYCKVVCTAASEFTLCLFSKIRAINFPTAWFLAPIVLEYQYTLPVLLIEFLVQCTVYQSMQSSHRPR